MNDTPNFDGKGRDVLIVDDDPDFRLQQKMQLEKHGFSVREADNRLSAHQELDAARPDLVIQDLMMDDPDTGFTLCYDMKRRFPDLPIIMITGAAAETGIDFSAGTSEERSWIKADVVLAKPIRFEQLLREIIRLLQG